MIMKKTVSPMGRRLGVLALAGVMAAAPLATPLAVPVMAVDNVQAVSQRAVNIVEHELAEGGHKLTVKNANAGATYKFYKLLDLETGTNEDGTQVTSYRYTAAAGDDGTVAKAVRDVLADAKFQYDAGKGMGFKLDANSSVVIFQKDELAKGADESDEAFQDRLAAQAKAEDRLMYDFADALRASVDVAGLPVAHTAKPEGVANGDSVVFSGLSDGYWMVATDAGVRSIVFTSPSEANGDMEMENKNPQPTLEKFVWDNDDVYAGKDASNNVLYFYEECKVDGCKAGHAWIKPSADNGKGTASAEGVEGAVKAHLGKYEADNDLGINDGTTFKINVDAKSGARNLVVTDTLDAGLDFPENAELDSVIFYPRDGRQVYKAVNEDGTAVDGELTDRIALKKGTEYTLTRTVVDGKTQLAIKFLPAFLDPDKTFDDAKANVYEGDPSRIDDDGGRIEIIYTVSLKDDAVKSMDGKKQFENSAVLEYGNDPDSPLTSNKVNTTTYTYQLDLFKHVMDKDVALKDAKFVLYRVPFNSHDGNYAGDKVTIGSTQKEMVDSFGEWVAAGAEEAEMEAKGIADNRTDGWGVVYLKQEEAGSATAPAIYVPVTEANAGVSEIVTPASGLVYIKGLDAGLYAFGETEAPKGYNRMEKPAMAVIGDTVINNGGKVYTPEDAGSSTFAPLQKDGTDSREVRIANGSGPRLPSTGGIGTVPFYVAGGVLVIGAGALMVVKKRREDGDSED